MPVTGLCLPGESPFLNNRDPENLVLKSTRNEHEKFIYNDTAFLLAMDIADGALFGYKTLDDLQKQEKSHGREQDPFSIQQVSLEAAILRRCSKAKGIRNGPMPRAAFTKIFGNALKNAGYLCATSIRAIHRQLGKKVDERYTEVQRSQYLTQGDPRIFGQSYVANTSSADDQAAFFYERADHCHIDYFQGLEKFREPGLL